MIYSLRALIPSADVQTMLGDGRWVSSVPLPFYPGLLDRIADAWAVFQERAVAVKYPVHGEFERAMNEHGWKVSR